MSVQELWTIVVAIAGGILTIFNVYKIYVDKKKEQKRERDKEIDKKLNEIKEQNKEQKEQLILITKVVITMNTELQTLGHLNGKTEKAIEELNNSLIEK